MTTKKLFFVVTCGVLAVAFAQRANGDVLFEERNGLVVVEVESVNAVPGWTERSTVPGFTGDSYYEWTGGNHFNNPGNGVLEYKIMINAPGTYRFLWHNKIMSGDDPTRSNDSWLRIPDADDFFAKDGNSIKYPQGGMFVQSNTIVEGASGDGWMKVYSHGTTSWTWSSSTSDHDRHDIYATFDSAGVYTVQISGRESNHAIDRFVLFKESMHSVSQATDLSNEETLYTGDISINNFDASPSAILYDDQPKEVGFSANVTSIGTIQSVTLNLENLGGESSVEMNKDGDKYSYTHTVSGQSIGNKKVFITAEDDEDNTYTTDLFVNIYYPTFTVVSVTASDYQDPNVPQNTIDGDLSTRWSADGDGQYIEYELDAPAVISEIRIAWFRGNERSAKFEIATSMDGEAWTNVYSDLTGSTSSTTAALQSYALTETVGQYVRIIGYGNTANSWNSILAVEILGTDPSGTTPPPEATGPKVNKTGETAISTSALIPDTTGFMNGGSFTQHAIVTYNGWQYAAYWNSDRQVSLARRELPFGNWQTLTLTDYTNTVNDGHNVISLDICPGDGTIHLSFDHHNNPLRYRRSITGLATNPENHRWVASNFGAIQNGLTGSTINPVTYPRFARVPNGNLQFVFRVGISGQGTSHLYEYDGSTQTWSRIGKFIDGTQESPLVGPYLNGFTYDSNGRLHVTWCWRQTANPMTNFDIHYIYSDDYGRTWKNNAGNQVGVTDSDYIMLSSPGIKIWTINQRRGLINQESQNVDSQGRIHILMSHFKDEDPDPTDWDDARDNAVPHHYWRDSDGTWHRTSMPFLSKRRRGKIFFDSNDNAYAVLPDIRIAAASASSNWSDWKIVESTDEDRFSRSDPLIDLYRVSKENKLTLYHQEGNFSTGRTPNLYALDYDLIPPGFSFQSWREHYFPDDLDDPSVSGADASPAGDAVQNLTKYALNLSPWERVAMKDLFDMSLSAEGHLILVYRRRTDVDDIEYIPEVSGDMIEWKSGDAHVAEVVVGEGEGYEEIEARGVASPAQKGFIRLKVRQKD